MPVGYEMQPPTPTAANGYPAPYNPPTPMAPTPTPIVAPTVPVAPNAISPANAASLRSTSPVAPPSFQGAADMLAQFGTGSNPILDAAFSIDGGRLAVAKPYGVFVYDLRAPRPLSFIDTASALPLRVFFTAWADHLVVSTHDDPQLGPRGATFFDPTTGQRSAMIRWPTSVNGIDSTIARLSPDGRILLIQQNFGAALYDALTLQPLPYWPPGFTAATFAFSPDSRLFAAGFGAVTVSDLATSNVVFDATQRGTAANEVPAIAFCSGRYNENPHTRYGLAKAHLEIMNGGLTRWIDGVQQANLTGVNNSNRVVDMVRLGPVAGITTGTRGVEYFDAFVSHRTSYIGGFSSNHSRGRLLALHIALTSVTPIPISSATPTPTLSATPTPTLSATPTMTRRAVVHQMAKLNPGLASLPRLVAAPSALASNGGLVVVPVSG
jgi:hypothetical protein